MDCCLWGDSYQETDPGAGGSGTGGPGERIGCKVAEPFRGCANGVCAQLGGGPPVPRLRSMARGERLEAGSGVKLWTVLGGTVALCTALADGRRQIVCLATQGDRFCPPDEDASLDFWIEALAPSHLCELDLTGHAGTIAGNASLSAALFRAARDQARCIHAHLVTLGRLDGMERVCLFLADMAWRVGEHTAQGWRVRLPLAREDIADYLGLNAETVSRIFSRVKKARLADFHSPTEYIVRDLAGLQNRAPILAPHSAEKSAAQNASEAALEQMEVHR